MSATPKPSVSVVMPVRNAMPYLDQAVQSILDQTFADFELVIGDDGSDDGSRECLERWAARDERIRLARREEPSGPAGSSNWVVEMAHCDIVARMDADDIVHPERLARQVAVLAEHPEAVMVASLWEGIDAKGRPVRSPDYAGLFTFDLFSRPFSHGSVMLRRSAFEKVGGYRSQCDFWEDSDLFFRLWHEGPVIILAEPLYSYRYTAKSNRLQVDPTRLERQLALKARCRAAAIDHGNYEGVLAGLSAKVDDEAVGIAVFQNRASIQIWAGARSHMLFDWLARGSRKNTLGNLAPLGFLVLAFLSPRFLRRLLGLKVRYANSRAKVKLKGRKYVFWRP